METTSEQPRADRLQTVADTIRRMVYAPDDRDRRWDDLEVSELGSDRKVDGFNMGVWLANQASAKGGPHPDGCRTVGCIAGTTVSLFEDEAKDAHANGQRFWDIAAAILGLDYETAHALFWGPPSMSDNVGSITREQAAVACERAASGCEADDIWPYV